MSRAARNSKVLRSGAIGFLAGLAALGAVASGSPARDLISGVIGGTSASVDARAGGLHPDREWHASRDRAQPSQDGWLVPRDEALPQYQQPQLPYAQPAPSEQPQSRAS